MTRINTLDAPDFVFWVQSVYGKNVFSVNDAPVDVFDDSEDIDGSSMTSWAANQVGSFLPGGAGHQAVFCFNRGLAIPVDKGLVTRGALLFTQHIVGVSLGDGKRTIEPLHRICGMRLNGASTLKDRWIVAALVPGVRY